MKPTRSLTLCLVLSAAAGSVEAYVRSMSPNGALLRRSDAANIQFLVNDQTQAGIMNRDGRPTITAGSNPMAALQASVDQWSQVESAEIQFAQLQTTALINNSNDGNHVIIFQDTDAIRAAVGGALAVAARRFGADGVITDSDILFNPDVMIQGQPVPFSTTLAANTIDIASVAAHELGHTLGAGHSGVIAATMFPRTAPATNLHATLSSDDLAFAREVYPSANVGANFGSIEGVVSRAGGGTANGVLVTAHDAGNGVVVSTFSDFADGTYRIGPLPPGNYFVSGEPVDGPLFPGDISQVNPADFDVDLQVGLLGGANDPGIVAVSGGQTSMASFALPAGPPALSIDAIGTSAEGALGAFMNFGPGALQFEDGQSFDLVMRGAGIDGTIRAEDIGLLGSGLNIRPATVMIDPFVQGLLRMTVDVGVVPGRRLATIALRKGDEGTIYSGALVILGSPVGPVFTAAGLGNAASLATGAVAALEIVSLFGENLAPALVQGAEPLPTEMAGTMVEVIDSQGTIRLAPLYFVSPGAGQINFVIPAGTAVGPAIIRVRTNEGVAEIMVQVERVAPGLFTPSGTGQGVGFAQLWRFSSNFLQVFSIEDAFQFDAAGGVFLTRPLDLNPANPNEQPVLVVVGTGIRAGAAVTATIDGQPAQVIGFAPQGQFTGLDQINILLSRNLIGRGTVILQLMVDGKATKPVEVSFQ